MRTTLTIEDDASDQAQAGAHARSLKLGQAGSELIRRSIGKLSMKQKNGVWVFDLQPGTSLATSRQVRDLMDDPS
ncbi:hypothetical protein [Ramlibacter tataouinensis]|uniref:hypothetical protein n=1 Tax=Ramlibacter tataouinensis TaxID=94132 RepID=UPI0002E70E23|nr:hypothetical protein [Ramlibacter tataouinensis]